jgi:prefoldin subunit 5
MGKPSQIDRAIEDIEGEIEVLQAALARLQRQKDEQQAKKVTVTP